MTKNTSSALRGLKQWEGINYYDVTAVAIIVAVSVADPGESYPDPDPNSKKTGLGSEPQEKENLDPQEKNLDPDSFCKKPGSGLDT